MILLQSCTEMFQPSVLGGFYMYTITKDGPDIHTTKKFGDIFVPLRFFIVISVPLWMEGVLTEGCKKTIIPLMPKIA